MTNIKNAFYSNRRHIDYPTYGLKKAIEIGTQKHDLVEKIACLECGDLFKSLASHLIAKHGMTGIEYRHKHNLKKGSLVCQDTRNIYLLQNPKKSKDGAKKRKEYWSKEENKKKKSLFMKEEYKRRLERGVYKTEGVLKTKELFKKIVKEKHLKFLALENVCEICKCVFTPITLVENGCFKNTDNIGSKKVFKKIKVCSHSCRSKLMSDQQKKRFESGDAKLELAAKRLGDLTGAVVIDGNYRFPLTCKNCKKIKYVKKYLLKKNKYCSYECAKKDNYGY